MNENSSVTTGVGGQYKWLPVTGGIGNL